MFRWVPSCDPWDAHRKRQFSSPPGHCSYPPNTPNAFSTSRSRFWSCCYANRTKKTTGHARCDLADHYCVRTCNWHGKVTNTEDFATAKWLDPWVRHPPPDALLRDNAFWWQYGCSRRPSLSSHLQLGYPSGPRTSSESFEIQILGRKQQRRVRWALLVLAWSRHCSLRMPTDHVAHCWSLLGMERRIEGYLRLGRLCKLA